MLTRFGMVPAALLHHPEIGVDEFAVLAALATYADRQGWCRVSQATLAERLKRSRPWIIKIINRLVTLTLIDREARFDRHGGQRTNLYQLRFDRLPASSENHPESSQMAFGTIASPSSETSSLSDTQISQTDLCSAPSEVPDVSHPSAAAKIQQNQPDRVSIPCHGDAPRHGDDRTHTDLLAKIPSLSRKRDDFRQIPKPIPADWSPSPEDIVWAQQHHPNIDPDAVTKCFTTKGREKRYLYTDFHQAWRHWISKQSAWQTQKQEMRNDIRKIETGFTHNRPPSHEPRLIDVRTGTAENDRIAADVLQRLMARRSGDIHP